MKLVSIFDKIISNDYLHFHPPPLEVDRLVARAAHYHYHRTTDLLLKGSGHYWHTKKVVYLSCFNAVSHQESI